MESQPETPVDRLYGAVANVMIVLNLVEDDPDDPELQSMLDNGVVDIVARYRELLSSGRPRQRGRL